MMAHLERRRAGGAPSWVWSRRQWLMLVLGLGWLVLAPAAWSAAALTQVFRPEKLAELDQAITAAITNGDAPGAVVWIERHGTAYVKAYGQRAVTPAPEPMTTNTIFDAASLTKVLATAPAILWLVEQGKIGLDDPVSKHLPEFVGEDREAITVRLLLTHYSGLPSGLTRRDFNGYAGAIAQAVSERPNPAPGTTFRYSDVNFILLGEIVRRVSGQSLADFAREKFYEPLGMRQTRFLPPDDWRANIAPTERVGGTVLRGVVHDPTARRMGGVAGHAGLFTTVADTARFCRMMLNEGELEGRRVLKAETVKLMVSVQSPPGGSARRGLGWDIDSPYAGPRGKVLPLGSYGHTGWTGTSLWIDPFSKTFVLLYTNRNHPSGGNVVKLRSVVATLAAEAVVGFDFANVPGALPPLPANSRP
ncbi:MAG: beta-lactamase family protein [Verrucomicrobiae bacterium]|nr:beta-lactamase family protein [Verrucomicrobiae bacterium]